MTSHLRSNLAFLSIALSIIAIFAAIISLLSPTNSYTFEVMQSLANFSIGMTKEQCISANGSPTLTIQNQNKIELRGFYPNPDRKPSGDVYIYEWNTYCIAVYFDENGLCEFIHIGYT